MPERQNSREAKEPALVSTNLDENGIFTHPEHYLEPKFHASLAPMSGVMITQGIRIDFPLKNLGGRF